MADDTVHLFLNPAAGRGRAGRRRERIVELLEARELRVVSHLSRDVGDLEAQVREHVDAGAERVVVAGGDGSVHEAVNGIMFASRRVAFGVVPTGTGNDFAKAAGITLDWQQATRSLADRIAGGTPYRVFDVGRMNDRFFANGAGIGLDAKVTRIARSYRLPIGDLVYLLAIFRTMLESIATPDMRIETDGGEFSGPITLANVANGPWIGGMFHIAPMAANDDGHFDLLIVDPVSRRRICSLLPKLVSGQHLDEAEITHRRVRQVTVEAADAVSSHLDGEVQPPGNRFEIELLAGALRLL